MSCIITKITKSTRGKHKKAAKLRDVGSTINYIIDAENHGDKIHENMIFTLNMDSADENIESWKEEIKQHHKEFKMDRGKGDPTGHYVISYEMGKGEALSLERIKAHVQIKLHHLGYDNHKTICAVHANTEYIHIHSVVDKVSPNKRDGKCYIPNDLGTVIHHDKKNKRHIRHEVLCQHAAIFDICKLESWSTDHCLVDNLGKKLKDIKKSLPKNVVKEEIRTGLKSTQRTIFETLDAYVAPKTSEEVASVFQKLGESGISYEIKYNKDKEIKGLVYTKDGKSLASSDSPNGWEHKKILPLITQTSEQDAKFLSKSRKNFLYDAFKHAKQHDIDYSNLQNYLKEYGYKLDKGRIHHEHGTCKFSEIWREFSSTKMEKAFAINLSKIPKTAIMPIVKNYENFKLNSITRQIANKMFASAKNKDAQLALLDLDIILEKAKIDHAFSQSELKYLEEQYEKTRSYIKSKDDSSFKTAYELANERITEQRLFEYKKEILDEYRNIAVNDIANINSAYNLVWNNNNLNLGVSHEKM